MLRLGTWESACLVRNDQIDRVLAQLCSTKNNQPDVLSLTGSYTFACRAMPTLWLCALNYFLRVICMDHLLNPFDWQCRMYSTSWTLAIGLRHSCQVVSSFSFIFHTFCFACFWGKMQSKGSEEVPSIFDLAAIKTKSHLTYYTHICNR